MGTKLTNNATADSVVISAMVGDRRRGAANTGIKLWGIRGSGRQVDDYDQGEVKNWGKFYRNSAEFDANFFIAIFF